MTFSQLRNFQKRYNKVEENSRLGKVKIWLWQFFQRILFLHEAKATWVLIHETVTAGSDHCFRTCPSVRLSVCPYVRPHFSKSIKTKQISSENNFHYKSGRVDHWWHLSFCVSFCRTAASNFSNTKVSIPLKTLSFFNEIHAFKYFFLAKRFFSNVDSKI